MSIELIDPELCNGCGICVNSCSVDVIRMDTETEKAIIRYPEDAGRYIYLTRKNLTTNSELGITRIIGIIRGSKGNQRKRTERASQSLFTFTCF
jgi:ferredoxin